MEKARIIAILNERMIKPFSDKIGRELPQIKMRMQSCVKGLQDILKEMLANEKQRCDQRLSEVGDPSPGIICSATLSYLNFVSALSAMDELKVRFEEIQK